MTNADYWYRYTLVYENGDYEHVGQLKDSHAIAFRRRKLTHIFDHSTFKEARAIELNIKKRRYSWKWKVADYMNAPVCTALISKGDGVRLIRMAQSNKIPQALPVNCWHFLMAPCCEQVQLVLKEKADKDVASGKLPTVKVQ